MRKKEKLSYTIEFHNQSFFMAPFVCAELILPDSKGVRIFRKRMIFPLLPFEKRKIQTTVSFKYRGLYPIRIEYVRLTDVFGLFTLRIPCNRQYTVLTLPNTSLSEIGKISDGMDNDTTTKKTLFGNDKIEMTDVRGYLPGDSLKLVHWKLSSRHDDMIVKVFDQPADNKASVLVDFSAVLPGVDERNEMSADAVAEIAASVCKGCNESGYEAVLYWQNGTGGTIRSLSVQTESDMDAALISLAKAPILHTSSKDDKLLCSAVSDEGESNLFYIISANPSKGLLDYAVALSASKTAQVRLIVFDVSGQFSADTAKHFHNMGLRMHVLTKGDMHYD